MTSLSTSTAPPAAVSTTGTTAHLDHDWQRAGDAWGSAASDWACLFEPYALDVVSAIFQRTGIGPGTRLLDVACGSGWAIRYAAGMGATTAGLDASTALMEIAGDRNPGADLRTGTMFDLPWSDESFDVVTSINGIWGDCDEALGEAFRVLRPSGLIGISFWGDGAPNDLRACFKVFARNSPSWHLEGMKKTNGIAFPGVAEGMLERADFEVLERGARVSTLEWPDADIAWRAMASVGPAVPALAHADHDQLRTDVIEAMTPSLGRDGVYRFRNDHHFVIARKPAR